MRRSHTVLGMLTLLSAFGSLLSFRVRSRTSLELELVALRHQLTVLRRQDLAQATAMHDQTPKNARLVKQKGALEKLIFMAQAEIGKIRKRFREPLRGVDG